MKDLTSTGASFLAQRCPENGDSGSGPTLETAFQRSADRTEYLRQLAEVNGVKKVRTVSTVSALKSIATAATGDIVMLTAAGTRGLYVYDATTAMATDLPPFGYGSSVLAGRWLSATFALVSGTTPAALRLDPQTLTVPNRIVQSFESSVGTNSVLASGGTWQDAGLVMNALPLLTGDLVSVRASVPWSMDIAGEAVSLRLAVVPPGGSATAIAYSDVNDLATPGINKIVQTLVEGRYAAAADGNHTFKLQYLTSGASFNVTFRSPRTIRGQVVRP